MAAGAAVFGGDRGDQQGALRQAGLGVVQRLAQLGEAPGVQQRVVEIVGVVVVLASSVAQQLAARLVDGDGLVEIGVGRIAHAVGVVFQQHREIRGDVGVLGLELARLAIRGDRAGAVEAFAEAPAHRVVLQRPAIASSRPARSSGSRRVAASASRCARAPSPASSSAEALRRRCTALRGYLRDQRLVGLQRALEIAVGAQCDADLVEGDELRLGARSARAAP